MRRLILFRHAKSDWSTGAADRDRPLAPRGRRDAPRMAHALAARGHKPDLALVSAARRTRQTWSMVKPEYFGECERFEAQLYEAPGEVVVALIRAVEAEVETLLVVGHNPGLEEAAGILTSPAAVASVIGQKFPTCAFMVIDFEVDDWAAVTPGSGRITDYLKPSMLPDG